MGKNLQRNNSMLSIQNRNPGCMWGVLQIVKYHRWRLLKKRNSHRGTGNEGHDCNASDPDRCPLLYSTEKDFYKIQAEKMNDSTQESKGTAKSQIKPHMPEEMHKKKDQLQRSSSYPALSRRLEPADGNLLRSATIKHKTTPHDVTLNSKGPAKLENEDLIDKKSRRNHWDGIRKEYIDKRGIVPRNSDRKQSLVNAREMLDALDLINTNKELLLKLLQDPSSPFVHHFHNEQALSTRRKFTRSTSFSWSSLSKGSSPIKYNLDKKGVNSDAQLSIAPEYKRRNHVVMNRFKDLKHKLKDMLKQNNNEKHRVAMDGILHRIPHGKEVPKDLKKDIVEQAKKQGLSKDIKEISNDSSLRSIKSEKHLRRSSSLKDSLDRYSRLYESFFNRDSKEIPKPKCEDSTSPQVNISKSIRRILSSPDLSHYVYRIEDYTNVYTSSDRKAFDKAVRSEHSDIESEVKTDIQQDLDSISQTVDDSGDSVTTDMAFHEQQDEKLTSEIVNETEADSKDQSAKSIEDTPVEPETYEVVTKEKPEFDYVKDVLHLSGFSGSELLGTWHSDDQPLDPSMLEEMDSVLFNSECFGVEEGYPCYNLLLFDLINQVLLEIYSKSYSYYPSPLNSRSYIHPTPVGSRVFDEVWSNISWYLSFSTESEQLLDYIASREFAKNDGWMNLQFDSECVAIEVDDMIFDDLLDEIFFDNFSDGMIVEDEFDEVNLS